VTSATDKKKVLIVDDEQGIRRLVREILNKNYVVIEAQNGEEAVSMAHNQRPDLILMDLMMPRMDGLTACSVIKKDLVTSAIPVVMLTAIAHGLNRKLAENVAADAYMTKPFTSQVLLGTVAQLLASTG
jgi:two-component system alkaline phosphatase synthesis response regulator PhoP